LRPRKRLAFEDGVAQSSTPANPIVRLPPPTASEPSPTVDHDRWFAEEVQPHEAALRSYLIQQFPTVRNDVDDVVQESYFSLLRIHGTKKIACARAYLFTIARHAALKIFRRQRSAPGISVDELTRLRLVEDGTHVVPIVNAREELSLVIEAIDGLPARCREVVILRAFHGLSHREIALQLGIAEQTVRVQMSRGVDKCTHFLRTRGVVRPLLR
jgi:RNA polymerase sigma-70 factor (ECF subfamily)